ncbi:MAG: NADH-quinone oxidoreductase subunit M [Candidatus Hydrogenedentes bacterium]|nr:NADH-quinone oxidoreductase subunit M [Candidatus Hydrogenedentota bacterium]
MGLLSWIIAVPFITMLFVVCVPARQWRAIRWISAFGCGIHLVLTTILVYRYWQEASPNMEAIRSANLATLFFVERIPWFPSLGITYYIGVDGISVSMIVLTSLIIFTGSLASWYVDIRTKEFYALLLLLVTGVFGVFVSYDLFLFFMFYELAVLPMYLLIGIWGTGPKEYAAMKLTLMLLVGSAFVLVGFFALYHASGLHTFDLQQLATVTYKNDFQRWVFPMVFVGFGVIGALYPFHTWSPDGHSSAPTAVSMLHAGVLMKLGGYGALRIAVYLLPEGAKMWALFFMVLSTINIVYGSFGAIMQKDLKYFTAYSSVSHCGFVLFGVATLNVIGFKGAVLQMFSHGIMTGLFFALIGMVYGRTHTRVIPEMGGLAKVMPWFATMFYIGGLASLGLPGLSGFVAETHVFLGGVFGNPWSDRTATLLLTIVATMSIVVTAVYVLRGLATVFQGPITNEHYLELTDARLPERLSTGILAATLFVVGLLPWLFINLTESSIVAIANRLTTAGTP